MDSKCSRCGSLVKEGVRFCNICGATLGYASVSALSPEDAEEIVSRVRELYASIPIIARPWVPPLPEVLRSIPVCARKHTLQQIIDLLEEAYARGEI